MKVIIAKDEKEVGKITANYFIDLINKKPNCVIGLATGSSPLTTYKYLVKDYQKNKTDWSKLTSFNLDEYVGLDHNNEQSYYYFMKNYLFKYLNIKESNIHVPNGIGDGLNNAKDYEQLLKNTNQIDLQLLGIGNNGHIAFNEPPANINSVTQVINLTESTFKANSRFFKSINDVPRQAITMGIKSILNAKKIIIIAIGLSKAEIVKKLIIIDSTPDIPATLLKNHSNVTLIIDEDAASLLQ